MCLQNIKYYNHKKNKILETAEQCRLLQCMTAFIGTVCSVDSWYFAQLVHNVIVDLDRILHINMKKRWTIVYVP